MSKKWIWILVIAGILVAVRIALPFFIENYVNKTLRNLEGYNGSVEDVDLALFRGAYVIDSVKIVKEKDSISIPFISIAKIDLSVHWKALFKGSIVGEIILEKPDVNFVTEQGKTKQNGSEADWTQTLKELIPLRINRFEINNGHVAFKDFSTNPKIDLAVENLHLLATNLTNIQSKEKTLPSGLEATGTSVGGGTFSANAKLNVLKEVPDLDLNFEFENVDMTALNDFIKAYANADVESGTFNLYTEIVVDDAELTGYVKPVMENLKIISLDKEEGGFFQKAWETLVAGVAELFENQPEEQLATQVPLSGNLNNPKIGVWPTVWNIFKNAFIEALSKKLNNTIDFSEQQNEKK